jgi:chitinase
MMWDASQAYGSRLACYYRSFLTPFLHSANNRYDLATKNALSAAGGTGFTFPACSAPAFSAGTIYSGGAQVSYGGYIWRNGLRQ